MHARQGGGSQPSGRMPEPSRRSSGRSASGDRAFGLGRLPPPPQPASVGGLTSVRRRFTGVGHLRVPVPATSVFGGVQPGPGRTKCRGCPQVPGSSTRSASASADVLRVAGSSLCRRALGRRFGATASSALPRLAGTGVAGVRARHAVGLEDARGRRRRQRRSSVQCRSSSAGHGLRVGMGGAASSNRLSRGAFLEDKRKPMGATSKAWWQHLAAQRTRQWSKALRSRETGRDSGPKHGNVWTDGGPPADRRREGKGRGDAALLLA